MERTSDDTADAPRAGCTTVVVTASVEKAALMAEVAQQVQRFRPSGERQLLRHLGQPATPSGVAESQLAEAGWDPAWAPRAGCVVAGMLHLAATASSRPHFARPTGHPACGRRVGGLHAAGHRHAEADGRGPRLARETAWLGRTSSRWPATRRAGPPTATPSGEHSSSARPTPSSPPRASTPPSAPISPPPARPRPDREGRHHPKPARTSRGSSARSCTTATPR